MKRTSKFLTIVIVSLLFSCEKKCDKVCGDCETLDKENCTCIPMECGQCETLDVENCTCKPLVCEDCETLDEISCTCVPMECGDCEVLDEENCICIVDIECQCNDGITNGNEEYRDCGGECDPCTYTCTYDPCIYLTNEATKIWKPVNIADKNGNLLNLTDTPKLEFRVDHTAIFTDQPSIWWFDNPREPLYLIVKWVDVEIEFSESLIFLSADSLALYSFISEQYYYYIPEE